jgi:hypothetical protein
MSSLSTSSISGLSDPYTPSTLGSDRAAGHVGGNGLPPESGSTCFAEAAAISDDVSQQPSVLSVWDFAHVQKHGSPKDNPTWSCLWCNQKFKQWNATKVLYHLVKVPGMNVSTCKGVHDIQSKTLYKSLLKDKDKVMANSETRAKTFEAGINEGQRSLAVIFEAGRKRLSKGAGTAPTTAREKGAEMKDGTVEASTASQLTMAIADFVHCSGLSFSATQGVQFRNILKLARGVTASYKPPARNAIATTLLTINYNRRIER